MDDKAEGYGVYCHVDGSKYEGDWKNDKQDGKGKETWQDGSVYEGSYQNGLKNGPGKFKWGDGSMYTGNFVNNNIHGHGIYIWKDFRNYDGEWVKVKAHSHGLIIGNTMESIRMIRKKGMGILNGRMDGSIRDTGRTGNNMVMGSFIRRRRRNGELVYGRMDNAYSG